MVKGSANSVAVFWVISYLSVAFVAASVGSAFQGENVWDPTQNNFLFFFPWIVWQKSP